MSYRVVLLTLIFWCMPEQAKTVGSDTKVTRVGHSFFPASEANKMLGFSVFEKGFSLENVATSCVYDGLHYVSGDMVLNGGNLQLQRNMVCAAPFTITSGFITGNANFMTFSGNTSTLTIPTLHHEKILTLKDVETLGGTVYSVDWSFDNQYVAVVTGLAAGQAELQIFSFDGIALTLVASEDVVANLYAVRWHPSDYYVAVGQSLPDELKIFSFDTGTNTLTQTDSLNIAAVYALAWRPDGSSLAVGESGSNQLSVYPFSAGSLGAAISYGFGSSRKVQLNALAWEGAGAYLAVGLERKSSATELQILFFDGLTLTLNASDEVNANVYAVAWQPGTNVLVVGNSSTTPLRLYEHDAGGGTLTLRSDLKADALGRRRIYGLQWSPSGIYLALSKQRDTTGHEVQVFTFDTAISSLHLVSGYKTGAHVYDVRWSLNGQRFACGGSDKKISVFEFAAASSTCSSIGVIFEEDVQIISPITFENVCVVDGRNHVVDLGQNGEIIVAPNGSLRLKNMTIKGASGSNIRCADNTGVLVLENVIWQQSGNVNFDNGEIEIEGTVDFVGEGAIFSRAANAIFSINSNATLKLHSGFSLQYLPPNDAKNLLTFDNNTSCLVLENASFYVGKGGIELENGRLIVQGASSIESDIVSELQGLDVVVTDEGISFGNGSEGSDFLVDIVGGATLCMKRGTLLYKNVSSSSWRMHDTFSILKLGSNAKLHLFNTLNLNGGQIHFVDSVSLIKEEGADLVGSITILDS